MRKLFLVDDVEFAPNTKIQMIKKVREKSNAGLKIAKEFVDFVTSSGDVHAVYTIGTSQNTATLRPIEALDYNDVVHLLDGRYAKVRVDDYRTGIAKIVVMGRYDTIEIQRDQIRFVADAESPCNQAYYAFEQTLPRPQ